MAARQSPPPFLPATLRTDRTYAGLPGLPRGVHLGHRGRMLRDGRKPPRSGSRSEAVAQGEHEALVGGLDPRSHGIDRRVGKKLHIDVAERRIAILAAREPAAGQSPLVADAGRPTPHHLGYILM